MKPVLYALAVIALLVAVPALESGAGLDGVPGRRSPAGLPPAPYTAGSKGYDASFPQCPSSPPPGRKAFAVVGLNHGRAFTANPCAAEQLKRAPTPAAVYVNTGYDPGNLGRVSAACRAAAGRRHGDPAHAGAWALGCSEAEFDLRLPHVRSSMWWLDVEDYNSWSAADQTLNQAALGGLIDRLSLAGLRLGVYSNPSQWREVVGDFHHIALSASWVAASVRPERRACSGPGFGGTPVWLVQLVDPVVAGGGATDADLAC